jgi:hypothetical protein
MARGTDQIVRKQNFFVPVTFVEPTSGTSSKEGEVRFGTAFKLIKDSLMVWSRVVPVRGTTLLVQAQDDFKRRITVSVLDLSNGQSRKLASFPFEPANPSDGAYAISRSGRYVLLAGPDKITIWDVVDWREAGNMGGAANALASVRDALIRGSGHPGIWCLTDDLRYVIVAPYRSTWMVHGEGGPVEPMPLNVAGVALDLSHEGVVFDRKTGTLSAFPREVPTLPNLQVVDADVVGGQFSLLYQLGPTTDLRVGVADTAGHARGSHVVHSFLAELAGWDPERDEVWFWIRDAHNSLPNVHPEADNHLIAWDVGMDRERRFRIPIDQIRRAVDGAK